MSRKETIYKIQISRLILGGFVFVVLIALALLFAFSKAGAPAPATVKNPAPLSTPAEENYNLKIDKIALDAPIIINVDGNNKDAYNKALEGGVAHLLGSALPGKAGNAFIFGHSSFYAWKPGNYKEIFKNLNDVEIGDTIIITSNSSTYKYLVRDKQIVTPDDVSVANQNYNEKKLTLMTCWPVGSDAKRLVIVGLLQN